MVAAAVDVGWVGLVLPGQQLHPAGLDVLAAADAALVGADEGREPGVVTQPGEAEGDVGRGAADVLGGLPVGGVHDVDEQLADDDDGAVLTGLLGPCLRESALHPIAGAIGRSGRPSATIWG